MTCFRFGAGLLMAVWALTAATAQIDTLAQNLTLPFESPKASVAQTIGLTDIRVDYYRPAVRGRAIWGKMLKFNEGKPYPWRAGANENTTIQFEHDVEINGHPLEAGTYGFHIILAEDAWTLVFSENSTSWGSFFYQPEEDALRLKVIPQEVPHREWLMYGFENLTENSTDVFLHWEELKVSFTVEVDVHPIVLASIRRELRGIPAFNWQGWYQAANYCFQNDINHEEALEWIDQSIRRGKNHHNLRLKGQLLVQSGDAEAARTLLEQALEVAPDPAKPGIEKILESL